LRHFWSRRRLYRWRLCRWLLDRRLNWRSRRLCRWLLGWNRRLPRSCFRLGCGRLYSNCFSAQWYWCTGKRICETGIALHPSGLVTAGKWAWSPCPRA
jgi:hypothetical protein